MCHSQEQFDTRKDPFRRILPSGRRRAGEPQQASSLCYKGPPESSPTLIPADRAASEAPHCTVLTPKGWSCPCWETCPLEPQLPLHHSPQDWEPQPLTTQSPRIAIALRPTPTPGCGFVLSLSEQPLLFEAPHPGSQVIL